MSPTLKEIEVVEIQTFLDALKEQGVDVSDEKFTIARRKAENPAGCQWCGARTKMAREVTKGKSKFLELACCGRKVG